MRRFCFGFARTLLIIVNLIIATLAALLVYISFNAFDKDYGLDTLSGDEERNSLHTYVSIICAGLGLLIILLSLLGLIGALKKSKTILITYAAIIFFMVSILFILVILTFSLNTQASSSIANQEIDKQWVNLTIAGYSYVGTRDWKTRLIDNLQRSLSCCGVNSPNDWSDAQQKIPSSCCSQPEENRLPKFKYCSESDFRIGCWKATSDYFYANQASVRIVLYLLMAFGLVCTMAACYMMATLKKILDVV